MPLFNVRRCNTPVRSTVRLNLKLTPLVLFRQILLLQIRIMSPDHRCFSLTVSKLGSSLLDIHGAFCLLNPLRCIRPGQKHTLSMAFSPHLEKKVG